MCFSFTWELHRNELETAEARNVTVLDYTYCVLKWNLVTAFHILFYHLV
jgi:hypothetical protein